MYETEEQQVEAIKEWWKENGASVLIGAVIGLAIVFGWQAWMQHRNWVAMEASNLFEQLTKSVESGDNDVAKQRASALRSDFDSTPYAAFAEFVEARRLYESKDVAGAKTALQQAINKAPEPSLATIAVLRLARLHISNGEIDAAQSLIDKYPASQAFIAEYAAVRGDIARAKGKIADARRAYQEALDSKVGQADLIQLKLDNLPPES
jgi:predicted negative regulator of RcsB-dependent stress response